MTSCIGIAPHRRTPGSAWTPLADARLAGLHAQGVSLRGIAQAMRLSRNAVVDRAARLGVHVPVKAISRPAPAQSSVIAAPDSLDDPSRDPLPAGHPITWGLITANTCLEGEVYAIPSQRRGIQR